MDKSLTPEEFIRLANNFYIEKGVDSDINRIGLDSHLINYYIAHQEDIKKKYKVAFCCICVNPTYWQFIHPMINGAKKLFLPGHDVDFLIWSDLDTSPEALIEAEAQTLEATLAVNNPERHPQLTKEIHDSYEQLKQPLDVTVFPIEAIEWPHPTLMRYHTMLQQEEKLKEYDYVFYCDIDMMFVNVVGDEVLGQRLTAVLQPMYATRKEWWPPYEPNEKSSSYIKRPGKVINDNGKSRFMPMYFAGGFQGGKTADWIVAMKEMKEMIDKDFGMNYIPVWNDESVFNAYLFKYPDDRDIILTPSYTYPDSLIEEYFVPMWGQRYQPKLVTLTKKFSFQPGAGEHLVKMLSETQKLQ